MDEMNNPSASLWAANRAVWSQYYPVPVPCPDSVAVVVKLCSHEDGFVYAECVTPRGRYFISRDENIAADLFSFRRETHQAIVQETDLFFLLGVGLGYRLRAAWETMEASQKGHVVVVEQSFSLLDAACRVCDLRDLFGSSRCEWIVGDDFDHEARGRIQKQSWFGARNCRFYWGYQVAEKGGQPPYDAWADALTRFMAEERKRFLQRWPEWVQRKKQSASRRHRIAVIYESHADPANEKMPAFPELLKTADAEVVSISIPAQGYISQTYLMQRILDTDPDELAWWGLPMGKWMPPEAAASLPIPSRMIDSQRVSS